MLTSKFVYRPNIPLSANLSNHLTKLNTHTRYIPPHPQRGSSYHRYVTLLLPQPPIFKYSLSAASRASEPTSVHLDIPVVPDEKRHGFDIREFTRMWGLDAGCGGGAHMWREVWDNDVSMIYRDILSESCFLVRDGLLTTCCVPVSIEKDEPRFSLPPKFNIYTELKQNKKYIL